MVTRLKSRFLPNDSSQSDFYKIFKHLIDKPILFTHKEMRFCFSDDINVGANYLLLSHVVVF